MGAELEAAPRGIGAGEWTGVNLPAASRRDDVERLGQPARRPAGGVAGEEQGALGWARHELGEIFEENGKIAVDRERLALRSVAP